MLVEKYAPKTIDDMILNQDIKDFFNAKIKEKSFPNMTLFGPAGIGKTTISKILINAIAPEDYLIIKCGEAGNVDTIRTTVADFCNTRAFDNIKIVLFDEADGLSRGVNGSGAQDALRGLIEDYQRDTRFILTCNFHNKLIEPLLSRCRPVNLQFTAKDVLKRIHYILTQENIEHTRDDLKVFFNKVVKKNFPKIRDMISILELSISDGKLDISKLEKDPLTDIRLFVTEILTMANGKCDLRDIKKFVIENEEKFNGDYKDLTSNIFEELYDKPILQVLLGDYYHRMHNVLLPEIEFFAMIADIRTTK